MFLLKDIFVNAGLMKKEKILLKKCIWASLVIQWLRVCLATQGTLVWSLVQEDLTCHGAAKPVHHNYWACALQQEKAPHWAVCVLKLENAGRNQRKPACSHDGSPQPTNKQISLKKKKMQGRQTSSGMRTSLLTAEGSPCPLQPPPLQLGKHQNDHCLWWCAALRQLLSLQPRRMNDLTFVPLTTFSAWKLLPSYWQHDR